MFNPIFFAIAGKSPTIAVYNLQNNATDKRNSFNGTVGGDVTFSAGVNGDCAVFNGSTNANINLSDRNIFSFTNGSNDLPFSIKMNFKQTTSTANPFLLTKNDASAGADDEYRIDVISGKVRIMLVDKVGAGGRIGKQMTATLSLNTFYNLIITYDGSKTEAGISIYIDGVLQSTTSSSSGSYTGMPNTTKPLMIGTSSLNNISDRFIGLIDELYIFNRALSTSDITLLQSTYY